MKPALAKFLVVPMLVLLPLVGSADPKGDLVTACGAKGWQPDFVTGDCINPRNPNERVRPSNLWPDFQSPAPRDSNLVYECGRLGQTPDFVTGKCR